MYEIRIACIGIVAALFLTVMSDHARSYGPKLPPALEGNPDQGGSPAAAKGSSVAPESNKQRWHTPVEIALTLGVLVFGAVLIGLEMLLVCKQPGWTSGATLKLLGLTLLVTAGMFLIVAGFDQIQIASMIGLLGSLAGYLLGKEHSQPAKEPEKQPPTQ
jgi:hypothetical protein